MRPPSPVSIVALQVRSRSVGRSIETEITTSLPLPESTCTDTLSRRGAAARRPRPGEKREPDDRTPHQRPLGLRTFGFQTIDVRLHLVAAALVDHLAAHTLPA